MSAREVYQQAIVPQFDTLPFQIPPIVPVVQPYKSVFTGLIALQSNTTFTDITVSVPGANFFNNKTLVSLELTDGVDFNGDLPFGISTWVPDSASNIIVSMWNSTNAVINVRILITNFY